MGGGTDQPKGVVKKLIVARNESEPKIRSRLLAEVLSDRCTFTDRERRRVVGRGAISDLIGEEMLDPEHWVKLKGTLSPSGSRYVFRWLVSSSIGKPRLELCVIELDDDGKVERLTVHHSVDASPSLTRQVFRWARDHPAPALAAAAGVLYAVLRISMAIFYNQFDMTPEEAGFSNDEVLRQGVTFLGVTLLYALALTILYWLAVTPHTRVIAAAQRLRLAQEPGKRRRIFALTWGPIVLAFAVFLYFAFLDDDPVATRIALGVALVSFLVVPQLVLRLGAVRRVIVLADESNRRERTLGLSTFLTMSSLATMPLLVLLLPVIAFTNADQVKDDGDAGGRVLPWRALPAKVTWTSSELIKLPRDCHYLRLLGESDGKVLIFDQSAQETVRIPSEDVIVSTGDC